MPNQKKPPETRNRTKMESEMTDQQYYKWLVLFFLIFGITGLIFLLIDGITILALPIGSTIPIFIDYATTIGVFLLGTSGILFLTLWLWKKRCVC